MLPKMRDEIILNTIIDASLTGLHQALAPSANVALTDRWG